MSLEQLILLALIQGITEFLPVSSSGHLSLVHELTGWADQGVLVDELPSTLEPLGRFCSIFGETSGQ